MKWRSELVFAVTLLGGVAPLVARAQTPVANPACACFVKPGGPGEPVGPGVPGTPGEPGTPPPATTPDDDSASPTRTWALLGATGLALLSGVPFGGGGAGGLPFVQGPPPPAPPPSQVAQLPTTPGVITRSGTVEDVRPATPGAVSPSERPTLPPASPGAGRPPVVGRVGMVPPKTATHLPLFGALGVLMTGSGAFLAHRAARQRRRRKRYVTL